MRYFKTTLIIRKIEPVWPNPAICFLQLLYKKTRRYKKTEKI